MLLDNPVQGRTGDAASFGCFGDVAVAFREDMLDVFFLKKFNHTLLGLIIGKAVKPAEETSETFFFITEDDIGLFDLLPVSNERCTMKRVLQFTHIPGPGIGRQDANGMRCQLLLRQILGRTKPPENIIRNQRDITHPFPQGRNFYRDHVDPIVEIFTECPGLDRSAEDL